MQATAEQLAVTNDRMLEYQDDPIDFCNRILGIPDDHIWPKMREVAESVRDNQRTAVPAGHSVSKTFGAARIAVWFKTVFNPSTVITTAPSDNQVRNQLWREIHQAYAGAQAPLGGKMTMLQWDCRPHPDNLEEMPPEERALWEKNFAIGFSTSPDSASEHATKMQGWHNKWLLVILDEAAGINLAIWKTVMEGLLVNERCKVLAIGNPTDPYSRFADVCRLPDWNVIRISTHDTPNYQQNKEIIPNLAGREHEKAIIAEYGENSNEHKIRCLGEFPTYMLGTVYGPEIAEVEEHERYGDYAWDRAFPVYTVGDYGNIYTAIGFFQYIRDTIRMIDYWYDDVGVGVAAICKMWDDQPYVYAKEMGHWLPPDYHPRHGSNRKSLGTGRSILAEFQRHGYRMNICEPHSFDNGVKVAREVLPLMRIDTRCSEFWDAMKQYKFKRNLIYSTDKRPAYNKDPEPTPARHPADMFRYEAWIYRYQLKVSGVRIGYLGAIPQPEWHDDEGVEDLLAL